MKKFLFLGGLLIALSSCEKAKELTKEVSGAQGYIEADVTIDGTTSHYNPSVLNVTRVDNLFNAVATEVKAYPTLSIFGSFPSDGTYISHKDNDIEIAVKDGTSDEDHHFNLAYAEDTSGTCTVVVTSRSGKNLEGTFSGTLFNEKGKKCEVKNGKFKVSAFL